VTEFQIEGWNVENTPSGLLARPRFHVPTELAAELFSLLGWKVPSLREVRLVPARHVVFIAT
jgi:hypothetical protein